MRSLRARLLVVLAALAVVGLVAADLVTYYSLRSFLVQRVDNSVGASATVLSHSPHLDPTDLRQLAASNPGGYVGIIDPSGAQWAQFRVRPGEHAPPPPKLPSSVIANPDQRDTYTLAASKGGTHFRARIVPLGPAAWLIIALPLDEVDATLNRLLTIELLVTVAVVAAIVGIGLYLVRVGLRPLREIEETAGAIAAGDLSRRIENTDQGTEVGRLGGALNTMLGQIESAFSERSASEARLRRFIADASHELRTPLSAVTAYAELFRRGARDRPDDLERAMAGIERESARMAVLVDDLLLLARLDQGRPLERKQVDLSELAGEAVDAARAVEPERPIELEAPEPLVVPGDPGRLRQVIDNLLANVRAHTPSSAAAKVRVRRENGSAVVEVADEGPGLTDEQAGKVFDRFYRGDPSRSRDAGSSGLGLAIVAAVAEAHGGDVSVRSVNGHGATFRVQLPLGSTSPDR